MVGTLILKEELVERMIGEANQTHFQIKNRKKQNYSDKQNSGNSIENGKGRTKNLPINI